MCLSLRTDEWIIMPRKPLPRVLDDRTPAFLSIYGLPEPFDRVCNLRNADMQLLNDLLIKQGARSRWRRFPAAAIMP